MRAEVTDHARSFGERVELIDRHRPQPEGEPMFLLGAMVVVDRIDIPWWVIGVAAALTAAAFFLLRRLARRV